MQQTYPQVLGVRPWTPGVGTVPTGFKRRQGEKSLHCPLCFLSSAYTQRATPKRYWVGDLPPGKGSYHFHLLAGDLWLGLNSSPGRDWTLNALLGTSSPPCSTQTTKPSSAWALRDLVTLPVRKEGSSAWQATQMPGCIVTSSHHRDSQFKLKLGHLWAPRPGPQMQTVKFVQWLWILTESEILRPEFGGQWIPCNKQGKQFILSAWFPGMKCKADILPHSMRFLLFLLPPKLIIATGG